MSSRSTRRGRPVALSSSTSRRRQVALWPTVSVAYNAQVTEFMFKETGGKSATKKEDAPVPGSAQQPEPQAEAGAQEDEPAHDYDSSEYEEVEVTDDEDGDGEDGSAPKRQRTEEPPNVLHHAQSPVASSQ